MNKTFVNQVLFFLKEVLGFFFQNTGTKGTFVDAAQTRLEPLSFVDRVERFCAKFQYDYDEKFQVFLVQNYDAPNTFNDWLVLIVDGKAFKVKVTGEGGKWTKRQREKYGVTWRGRWVTGQYKNAFAISRDGANEFMRIGMPALWNCKKVKLMNLDTGHIGYSANCDKHGRRSMRDLVNVSSAGCIVTKAGRKIYDVVDLYKQSYIYKRDGIEARFDLTVATIADFPSIKGVKHL